VQASKPNMIFARDMIAYQTCSEAIKFGRFNGIHHTELDETEAPEVVQCFIRRWLGMVPTSSCCTSLALCVSE
jgi:hypothetical protein